MTLGAKLLTLVLLSLGAVCAVGVWFGYQLFTTAFSAKTEPHAIEVLMARQIRHLAIPIEKRNAPNPELPSKTYMRLMVSTVWLRNSTFG